MKLDLGIHIGNTRFVLEIGCDSNYLYWLVLPIDTDALAKAESNRQCKCIFAPPFSTVPHKFPLQQVMQKRKAFCL
jgi:hypothetical protein